MMNKFTGPVSDSPTPHTSYRGKFRPVTYASGDNAIVGRTVFETARRGKWLEQPVQSDSGLRI